MALGPHLVCMLLLYASPLQLLIAHKAELEGLEKRLDTEKDRQLLALREKLRAKRDQKLDDQRRRQEFVFQKELLEQRKEMDVIKTKQVCVCAFMYAHVDLKYTYVPTLYMYTVCVMWGSLFKSKFVYRYLPYSELM